MLHFCFREVDRIVLHTLLSFLRSAGKDFVVFPIQSKCQCRLQQRARYLHFIAVHRKEDIAVTQATAVVSACGVCDVQVIHFSVLKQTDCRELIAPTP